MTQYTNEQVVEGFLDHVRFLAIAHHVPGRIRVKASWRNIKQLAGIDAKQLQEIIERIPGIVDYRVNRKALAVIINYDTEILPFDLWEDIGSLGQYPVKQGEVKKRLLGILNSA